STEAGAALLWVPTYASDRLVIMNRPASTAVARDNAVPAPRAPNTVPEAPAPKPAPASAPLPRCTSTSAMIPAEQKYWAIISTLCSIATQTSAARRGDNTQEFIGLQRRAADQATVNVRHCKQLPRVASLDAATIEDANIRRDFSILPGHALTNE